LNSIRASIFDKAEKKMKHCERHYSEFYADAGAMIEVSAYSAGRMIYYAQCDFSCTFYFSVSFCFSSVVAILCLSVCYMLFVCPSVIRTAVWFISAESMLNPNRQFLSFFF